MVQMDESLKRTFSLVLFIIRDYVIWLQINSRYFHGISFTHSFCFVSSSEIIRLCKHNIKNQLFFGYT